MSGLYDNLGVSRIKTEPISPPSPTGLYAGLTQELQSTVKKFDTNTLPNPIQMNPSTLISKPPLSSYISQPSAVQQSLSASYQTNALFVGNLQWWTRDQDLLNIFSQFGTVTALKIHADKVNGKSKGHAYIQYAESNAEAAAHAKDKLNGFLLHENKLTITFASPDKIKLPEFSNTHFPNSQQNNGLNSRIHSFGGLGSVPGFGQDGGLGNLTPGLTDLNSLNFGGLTNSALLKQLNLDGAGNIGALLSTLRQKDVSSSGSRSRSSSFSASPSRSYSRSRSRSRSQKKRKRRRSSREKPVEINDRSLKRERGSGERRSGGNSQDRNQKRSSRDHEDKKRDRSRSRDRGRNTRRRSRRSRDRSNDRNRGRRR